MELKKFNSNKIMSQYLIYFISLVIILILILAILLQQAEFYHTIIKDARRFANNKYV